VSGRTAEFEVRSRLAAPPDQVWERIATAAGVNAELMPLVRMTAPRELQRLAPEKVELGTRLCRSWILLFGVIPIDYDDIVLERLESGRGFLERSTMLSQRLWEHERTLEPTTNGEGCLLTDRIRFEPRLSLPAGWLRPLFRLVFRHRHGRLRRHFGGVAA
jgi:ligand-binding SRPBCC domain-containing protein